MVKIIRKKVKSLGFHLLSPEKIKKIARAKIITPELYDVDGYPVDGGLMDLRLGAIDPGVRCRTCGGRLKECLGHPGMIELARPAIHIKYIPVIELFLRCFCKGCGKLMLSEENIKKYTNIKKRVKKAKDVKKCPYCGHIQQKVKLELESLKTRPKLNKSNISLFFYYGQPIGGFLACFSKKLCVSSPLFMRVPRLSAIFFHFFSKKLAISKT